MTRTSKYLGKEFEGGWTCINVGIARVQPRKTKARKPSKNPGRASYYYEFQRRTSDGKADKSIRVDCNTAAKIYRGQVKVEDILNERESKKETDFTKKVSYQFT